jgi:hypothetical protein
MAIVPLAMRGHHITGRIGLAVAAMTALLALSSMAGSARGATSCSQIPTVYGIPPWGFHTGSIIMSVEHHLSYHSHYATMWGYPGNIIKIKFRVTSSTDTNCTEGTVGRATLFGSYNGVRSDSVQFFFPAACKDQDHLYHGTEVNNQVPPL